MKSSYCPTLMMTLFMITMSMLPWEMPRNEVQQAKDYSYSAKVWSAAMFYNAKLCTRRWRPTSEFLHLPGFVVQTLFLSLKLLVK